MFSVFKIKGVQVSSQCPTFHYSLFTTHITLFALSLFIVHCLFIVCCREPTDNWEVASWCFATARKNSNPSVSAAERMRYLAQKMEIEKQVWGREGVWGGGVFES